MNVSRGAIVDSDALIARLKRGDIVAGLDVFDPEPIPPDSEIIGLPNTFLSPHIAGVTLASYQRFFTLMVDELGCVDFTSAARNLIPIRCDAAIYP